MFDSDEDKAPEIHEMPFKDRIAVEEFMINRQLSRRNVSDAVQVKLALKLKPIIEARAKAKQAAGGSKKVVQDFAQPPKTRDEVAKAAGVSGETVRKVEAVLNSDNEDIKAAMLAPKSDPKHVSIHAAHEAVKEASKLPRRFCRVAFLDDVRVADGRRNAAASILRIRFLWGTQREPITSPLPADYRSSGSIKEISTDGPHVKRWRSYRSLENLRCFNETTPTLVIGVGVVVATSLAATLCDAMATCRRVPRREIDTAIDTNKRTRRSSPSQFFGGQSELPRLRVCKFHETCWDGRSVLNSVERVVRWIGKILHCDCSF